jgi:hypothetical protein
MRRGRPFYCALLLDSELDSNLNCFWPPPRGLDPDQPWTSLLTWKPLLDFFYSIPCTNHGRMHECHVLITRHNMNIATCWAQQSIYIFLQKSLRQKKHKGKISHIKDLLSNIMQIFVHRLYMIQLATYPKFSRITFLNFELKQKGVKLNSKFHSNL